MAKDVVIRSATGPIPLNAAVVDETAALPVLPERRHQARFRCEGKAQILQPQSGLTISGRIQNVSAAGCFIEAPSVNLERGARVEVYFETKQLQFRVMGNVLALSPGAGVGILFVHPSDRVRRQIAELVRELAE